MEKKKQDDLTTMWEDQDSFMKILQEHRDFPSYPVDILSKDGQKFLKKISYECMGELWEANQLLKNGKDHRISEIKEFDRDKYVEECIDALHYFFEIMIASGITKEELVEAYMKKGEINKKRILEEGY